MRYLLAVGVWAATNGPQLLSLWPWTFLCLSSGVFAPFVADVRRRTLTRHTLISHTRSLLSSTVQTLHATPPIPCKHASLSLTVTQNTARVSTYARAAVSRRPAGHRGAEGGAGGIYWTHRSSPGTSRPHPLPPNRLQKHEPSEKTCGRPFPPSEPRHREYEEGRGWERGGYLGFASPGSDRTNRPFAGPSARAAANGAHCCFYRCGRTAAEAGLWRWRVRKLRWWGWG